jgi:hypothetical protein
MNILAELSKHHGFITNDITARMKIPILMVSYFGNKATIEFPAGREFEDRGED